MANSPRLISMGYQTMQTSHSDDKRPAGHQVPAVPPRHGWKELVGVASVLGFLALGMVAAMAAWNAGDVPTHVQTTTYVVRPGDSAWSIANRDKQYVTGALEQWITDRYGSNLQPGEVIRIPAR